MTTNNGTLLGVYDIRYNSSVDLQEKIDIGVSRSTDKGTNLGTDAVAMTFKQTDGLPRTKRRGRPIDLGRRKDQYDLGSSRMDAWYG